MDFSHARTKIITLRYGMLQYASLIVTVDPIDVTISYNHTST